MFDPATVTIKAGETVTWTNNVGFPHNVVFDEDSIPVRFYLLQNIGTICSRHRCGLGSSCVLIVLSCLSQSRVLQLANDVPDGSTNGLKTIFD